MLDYSALEKTNGMLEAKRLWDVIDRDACQLEKDLPKTRFSYDYVRGLHYGDGSLTGVYQQRGSKYAVIPTWSISSPEKAFVKALLYTFNKKGHITKTGKEYSCFQYRITGIDTFMFVLEPIFANIPMHTVNKQRQWNNMVAAINIMRAKKHCNFEGWCKLIDLTYDLSENSKRQQTKEFFKNKNFVPKA